ncbi:MAG: hypothetical protein JWL69_2285 [Phycisphaerales bacterium]|nr:hypothetical protein [Phycisphaerales bacterium]MDB5358067.1 hypothetical protein [Phycisphaerales bacterium]
MLSIVLIVDDDAPRARRTADWLIDAGHRVVHTRDLWSAAMAVNAVRAGVVVIAPEMTECADAQALDRFASTVKSAGVRVICIGPPIPKNPAAGDDSDYVFVNYDRADLLAAVARYATSSTDWPGQNQTGRVPFSDLF